MRCVSIVCAVMPAFPITAGCSHQNPNPVAAAPAASSQPTTQPAVVFDTTVARPISPRDRLERLALERGADFKLIDRLMDERTRVPEFSREPLPPLPADARISEDVTVLDDNEPFPDRVELTPKEPTILVGLARSTYRTREPQEVLAAVQPFIDLEHRQVNVRGDVTLYDRASQAFFGLRDGHEQLVISHVFDYLLVRSWMSKQPDNGTILLGVARPARPRTTPLDAHLTGIAGTSIELAILADAAYEKPADLKGARLTLAANVTHAPGTFLTGMLREAGHTLDQPFFGTVTLRRYPKDAVIDLLKGRADVACVDQGTVAALQRMYGLEKRLRTLAVSPRYHLDVLYTSVNNVATHRTEIELTQRQLTTLQKDPEGQEVLFFFDQEGWQYPVESDLSAAEQAFEDFLTFYERTPADLKPLLDQAAPVDRSTYDRLGDE